MKIESGLGKIKKGLQEKSNGVINVIHDAVSHLDSIVSLIVTSKMAQDETIRELKRSTKNVKLCVDELSKSIYAITQSLAELYSKNIQSIIDSASISMSFSIKSIINSKQDGQFTGPIKILVSYAKLVQLLSELSEYSKTLNVRAIKRSSKAVITVFKYLVRMQARMKITQKLIDLFGLDKRISEFLGRTKEIIAQSTLVMEAMGGLLKAYEEAGGRKLKRRLKRAIKSMFVVYNEFALQSLKLVKFDTLLGILVLRATVKPMAELFNSLIPVIQMILEIGANYKAAKKGIHGLNIIMYGDVLNDGLIDILTSDTLQKISIKNILNMIKAIAAVSIAMKILEPTIPVIINIGNNKIKIISGMILLEAMLIGNKRNKYLKIKSLPHILSSVGRRKTTYIRNSIWVLALLDIAMMEIFIISSVLRSIGVNFKYIRRGLKGVELILLGSDGILGIGKRKSLIQIISSITNKDIKNIKRVSGSILILTGLSLALLILGLNLAALGRQYRYIKRGVKSVKFMMTLFEYFNDVYKYTKKHKLDSKKLWEVGKLLIIVGTILTIIAIESSVIGLNLLGIMLAIPAMLLLKVVIMELVWLSKYIKKHKKTLNDSSKDFIKVGGLMRIIARIFLLFITLKFTLASILLTSGIMLSMVGNLFLVMLAILLIGKIISPAKTSLSILSITIGALALWLIAKTFISISESMNKIKIENIIAFYGLLVSTIGVFALMGLASPLLLLAIASAASILVISGAMLLLIVPIMILANINTDDVDKAKENAHNIIDASFAIIKDMVDTQANLFYTPKPDDGLFARILGSTGSIAASLITVVCSFIFIAFTFAAVTLLLMTAAEVSLLSKINIPDLGKARENTSSVLAIANDIISAVCAPAPAKPQGADKEDEGFFKSIFTSLKDSKLGQIISGGAEVVKSLMSFGYIATIMLTIGMVTLVAKNIKYLSELKIESGKAKTNTINLLQDTQSIIDTVKVFDIKKEKDVLRSLRFAVDVTRLIKKISKNIEKIGESKPGSIDTVLSSYEKLITKVDKVDLEKLKTTATLFEKMSDFSKSINGNFEGLADTLNEKIAPLLEKLQEQIDDIKNSGISVSTETSVLNNEGSPVLRTTSTPVQNYGNAPSNDWRVPEISNGETSIYDLLLALNMGLFGNPEPTTQQRLKF